jgi:hypothetical protein
MFDPNLPPPFPIVEDDLVYVITGYNKINCLPDSRESSIQNLRRYLVRISGVSGIGVDNDNYRAILFSTAQEDNLIDINYSSSYPYYQSIATTGLNARVGNNMEIQFALSTPAANKYGGVGGKYFSGIISTTGLNAKTENLIVRDFESFWPYSGIIYNTGLNARVGNNMEIQFTTGTPAANIYGGVGSKYFSGIISTTGLNARTENLIVRDFETTWPYSGVIYNTGLNAVVGNNMEVQFYAGTPAANKYGRVGGKYVSGIVSTTGLNARTENLIVRDFETTWPYSGVIYNTGLNARAGNLIEIQYKTASPAGGLYGGTEGKYWSGIISTTGLNMVDGNNIAYTISSSFPHKYTIFTVDRASKATGLVTFSNNNHKTFNTTVAFTDPDLLIDYRSLYTSKTNENIDLISSFKFLLPENSITFTIPYPSVVDFLPISGDTYATGVDTCRESGGGCIMIAPVIWYRDTFVSDLSGWEALELSIVSGSFDFSISCSGGTSSVFAQYPITFTNLGTGIPNPNGGTFTFGSNFIYEKYRSTSDGSNRYNLNNIDPMETEFAQTLTIDRGDMINSNNATSPQFNVSNFAYVRKYRKRIGYANICTVYNQFGDSYCQSTPVYRYYTTPNIYAPATVTIGKRFFKTNPTVKVSPSDFSNWSQNYPANSSSMTGQTSGAIQIALYTSSLGVKNGRVTAGVGSTVTGTFIVGELVVIITSSLGIGIPDISGTYRIASIGTDGGYPSVILESANV